MSSYPSSPLLPKPQTGSGFGEGGEGGTRWVTRDVDLLVLEWVQKTIVVLFIFSFFFHSSFVVLFFLFFRGGNSSKKAVKFVWEQRPKSNDSGGQTPFFGTCISHFFMFSLFGWVVLLGLLLLWVVLRFPPPFVNTTQQNRGEKHHHPKNEEKEGSSTQKGEGKTQHHPSWNLDLTWTPKSMWK